MRKEKAAKNHRYYVRREFALKVLGGAVLLISFVTQNYFYDKWNTQSQDSHSAAIEQSLIDKSVLLNENLFFAAGSRADSIDPNEVENVRRQYIREAARKSALAKSVWILASDLDKRQKLDLSNTLMSRANGVKDFASFSDFNKSVNERDAQYADTIRGQIDALEQKRKTSSYLYLALYLLGSLLFLSSLLFERRRILNEVE